MKVDFLIVPFFDMHYLHTGISCLTSYLKGKGAQIKVHNLNLKLFDLFQRELPFYKHDIELWGERYRLHPGQFLFSSLIFPEYHKENRYLQKTFELIYCIDFDALKEKLEADFFSFIKAIDLSSSDLIGISLNDAQLLPAVYIAKEIKREHPDIPIVIGGVLCYPEISKQILSLFDCFDIAVFGEGEKTLYEILSKLPYYEKFLKIDGTVQRTRSNDIVINPTRLQMNSEELDNLPYPDFTWDDSGSLTDELPIVGSRGCYYARCKFCNDIRWWQSFSERSVESIVKEMLHQMEKYKRHRFRFYDLAINSSIERMEKLCNAIIDTKKEFDLWCLMRADNVDQGLLKRMKAAGFNRVRCGMEAISSRILKKMGKGTKAMDNLRFIKLAKEASIKFMGSLITRYPLEDLDDVLETLEMIKRYPHLLNKDIIVQTYDFKWRYGSTITKYLERDQDVRFKDSPLSSYLFPENIRNKLTHLEYIIDYSNDHKNLINELWNYIPRVLEQNTTSKMVYKMENKCIIIKINRGMRGSNHIVLDRTQSKIFLKLHDVKSFSELSADLDLDEGIITESIKWLVDQGVVYKEKDRYLGMALPQEDLHFC